MADSNFTHIDVNTLPTTPDSPTWESPHRLVSQFGSCGGIIIMPFHPTTPTGKFLRLLAIHLEHIIKNLAPMDEIQAFLERYKISDVSDGGKSRIHPLVQEWVAWRDVLRTAFEKDRIDVAKYLLDEGFTGSGDAIHLLCIKSPDMFKRVVEQGKWDINRPISEFMPPVLGSCVKSDDMIRWLLSRGANPELASSSGSYTILQRVAQYATASCLSLLLSAAPGSVLPGTLSADVIFHATTTHESGHDRIHIMKILLDNGAPIDMVSGCGRYEPDNTDIRAHFCDLWRDGRKTALHYAVEHHQADVVKFLLERGADVDKMTWSGTTKCKWVTVVELAEMCGHHDLVDLLKSYSVLNQP